MTLDTRTPAEIKYDAERSGAAWLKEDDRITLAREADILISQDEQQVIDHILQMPDGREIPVIRSKDQAERDARWAAIIEQIADLDEPEQSELIGYTLGLFDGMGMKKRKV